MLSRSASIVARKVLPRTTTAVFARSFAADASAPTDSTSVILNFSVPYESIYKGVPVASVIIPGVEGEYGVTANHVPYVAQMKPGVLQILFEDGSEAEKYFVAGGYALTHANSVTVSVLQ
jgi:F-type H+-transporting ATPase subunit delta